MKKKTLYIFSILLFIFSLSACGAIYHFLVKNNTKTNNGSNPPLSNSIDASKYGLTKDIKDGVILQAWCWSFKTIKENMADIAYAGYTTIQTSPINACVVGGNGGMQLSGDGKWWYHYQPTDWTIGNYQLGTRDEFIDLCKEADKYGIKIIVDVVPNHTGPSDKVLDGLKDSVGGIDKLYHPNAQKAIENYGDRLQCTMLAMGGLIDVDTENAAFQDYFIKYIKDCIACGADGFRYDTAKHIALPDDPMLNNKQNNFWTRVISETSTNNNIFNYGEVLQGDNDRLAAYADAIGRTTASSYGHNIRTAVNSGIIPSIAVTNYSASSVNSSSLVTWFESHDNYINDGTYSFSDDQVILGWTIITATGNGTPLFYSRPYGNTSKNYFGTLNRIGLAGNNTFKDERVVAANRFRNATVGEPCKVTNLDTTNKTLFIERGSLGAVIVNNLNTSYNVDTSTSLADGSYSDKINNKITFTVSNGKLTGVVPAGSFVILCNSDKYVELPKISIPDVGEDTQFTSYDETQTVKLVAKNATKATYSINNSKPVEYTDGQTITMGADCKVGDSYDLVLTTNNEHNHVSTRTFTFIKKQPVSSGSVIKFQAPSSWNTTIHAYVYDESGSTTVENASWPGAPMQKEADGTYSYKLEGDWKNALVIFNDGSNQYPGSMEPGFAVIADKLYTTN